MFVMEGMLITFVEIQILIVIFLRKNFRQRNILKKIKSKNIKWENEDDLLSFI